MMNECEFCYWLQGFVELSDANKISPEQWLVIKDHLKLVMEKQTPVREFVDKDISKPSLPDFNLGPSNFKFPNDLHSTRKLC